MRTHRHRLSLTVSTSFALGLALASLAEAQSAPQGGVKYMYKPVPCTPCPCECPDAAAPKPSRVVASDNSSREPESRPAASPSQGGGDSGREAAAVSTARGNLGGVVTLKDRGGKEKSDRSNVVVYVESLPNKKFAALKKVRQMAQRDKAFVPTVVAVTKGSTVDFPNEDKFFHNVFSLSDGNTFDLGLYRAGDSKSVTFEKTGVVDVYCNIHPNMWAQILVLENPFFTTTGRDGTFELAKLPPGTYTVAAWSPGGEITRQQVKIEPGKRAELAFEVREGATSKQHNNKFNQPYDRYK